MRRHDEASCRQRLEDRVGRIDLRQVEVAERDDVRHVGVLAAAPPVGPPGDGVGLERPAIDVGLGGRAVEQVDAHHLEPERGGLERAEIGPAVEPGEGRRRPGNLDLGQLARRDREATDLLEQADLRRVVQERLALEVARRVREEQRVAGRQRLLDREDAAEVVVHLLDGDHVEPADDLGDQPVVGVDPLLDAEIGDVPGREQQAVARLCRDLPARCGVAIRPQCVDLRAGVVGVVERRLRERRHARTRSGRSSRRGRGPAARRPRPRGGACSVRRRSRARRARGRRRRALEGGKGRGHGRILRCRSRVYVLSPRGGLCQASTATAARNARRRSRSALIRRGSGTGTAASRAFVYGWLGAV